MGFFSSLKVWSFFGFCFIIEVIKNVFGIRRRYRGNVRLEGKVVVITGANTGIGKETALQISLRGAKVIIGCRDVEKGQTVVEEIRKKSPDTSLCVIKLDLSSLKSVRQFVKSVEEKESKIDILINNAGVMNCPEAQTEDGFEMQLGTNHLGHFLLTLSLLPRLRNSPKARVVTLASSAHMFGQIHFENINLRNAYKPATAYSQSKLANVLFTREMAKKLGSQSNIKAYCLHPGIINSELWRYQTSFDRFITRLLSINTELGAQTTLYCVLEESIENDSGFYYDDCKRVKDKWMVRNAIDDNSANLLWELSSDLVKLEDNLKLNSN